MKENSQALIFLSFVAHLIILVHAQTTTTLITQTCKQTSNYNLCVSTLNSDPKTGGAKDMRDLAIIMVNHVHDAASKTQNHCFGLIRNRGITEPVRGLLNKCYNAYFLITTNRLNEITDGLSAKNYGLARQIMEAIPKDVEACENSFKAPIKSPISDDNKAMDDISKVTYAIVYYLAMHPVSPFAKQTA